ncbi:MAG: hypothetical protein L0Y73_03565, partial [Candidatus Aminicenantes bacterium]|nr:hypothetical protein [Candidatus Aminicenantes bacterium]
WPALQWIYHHKPPLTKNDYIKIAKDNFHEDQKSGHIGEKFKNFYWTIINNDELVIQRVRKGVSERKWDHDWGRAIAVLGDANTAKQFLSGKSGQQETKDTAVENAYSGALQWLEENALNPDKIDFQKLFARQISWITMADGIIDWVAYDKGANDNWARGTASLLSSVPREANMGNHPGLNVGGQRDIIRDLLEKLDPVVFRMIRDAGEARRNKEGYGVRVKDYLNSKYKGLAGDLSGVTQIDHIFDRMDAIINAIVYSYSPDKFKSIVKEWRASAVSKA